MSSDAVPVPESDPEATPEQYRQRALLLADLGRYDEAAGELAAGLATAAADPGLLSTLARVHLVAEQPVEALTAAERAAAAAPDTIEPLVLRAMALADDRRFGEAARAGAEVLQRWPDDAYAQRTGAALLSESRNGQEALNAAWTAVKLSPRDADAHLVLAVVSARLRLFDLAQRAYAEALELDSGLGEAQHDVGVVRLERRRWARALEQLADAATLTAPPEPPRGGPAPEPGQAPPGQVVPGDGPPGSVPPRVARGRAVPDPAELVSRPSGPVLDPSGRAVAALRQAVLAGAGTVMAAAFISAVMTTVSPGVSRAWAAVMGLVVPVAVLFWLGRQLTEPLAAAVRRVRGHRPRLVAAGYAGVAATVLIIAYAAVGGPVPLVAALVVAATAELLVLTDRH